MIGVNSYLIWVFIDWLKLLVGYWPEHTPGVNMAFIILWSLMLTMMLIFWSKSTNKIESVEKD